MSFFRQFQTFMNSVIDYFLLVFYYVSYFYLLLLSVKSYKVFI